MSRRAWLFAIPPSLLLWAAIFLIVSAVANAKVGVAAGIGPHLSNPLTPHIGRVYYKPGDKATRELSASHVKDDLDSVIADLEGVHKARCAVLHAQYVERHGVTTPRPLKGYHGCVKYAKDEGYWKTRRGERISVSTPTAQITTLVHNSIVNSVPYSVSGVFSLTDWNSL